MVKKAIKKDKRDSKGRFKKGKKGGPGRPPGTVEDMLAPGGKKRDVRILIDDLLTTYAALGGTKFLTKWAKQNYKNLSRFVDILYKFAPEPDRFSPSDEDHAPIRYILYDDQVMLARIEELEAIMKKSKLAIPASKDMERIADNKLGFAGNKLGSPENQRQRTATEIIKTEDSKEPRQLPESKKEVKKPEEKIMTMEEILLSQQQQGRKRKRRISDDDSWVTHTGDDD